MKVVRFLNLIKVLLRVKPVRDVTLWKNPSLNSLKFNEDDSSKGKSEPKGIGGVLRDSIVTIKIVFSKAGW